MEIVSNFAVFEGGDGAGTTTQLNILKERFKKNKTPVFYPTFEPTDGQIGVLIRSALKKDVIFQPETLALLFAADRNEHLFSENGILTHIKNGELVISDRYVLSSLVYQGIDCSDELPTKLNSSFPAPELLIFLDVNPETALLRLADRQIKEIYEYRDFQEQVRYKYKLLLDMYRQAGVRVAVIDAAQSADNTAAQVWSVLSQMPIIKANENSL